MGTLTGRKLRAGAAGKYTDGDGLPPHVYSTGARNWVFRYHREGYSGEMVLGAYPVAGLAEARQLGAEAKQVLRSGADPIDARKADKSLR